MRYSGLLGRSIKYSISPLIHNEYYKANNICLEYKLFDIEKNNIEEFIHSVREKNIVGFNVTIPYKEHIISFLDEVTYPANYIGAVNTVVVRSDKLIGYNTDYYGFIKTLKDINFCIKGCKALVIGSGGAAKAVLYALYDNGASSIEVVARNQEALKNSKSIISKVWGFNEEFFLEDYQIVINCTPLGGGNHAEKQPINIISANKNTLFYDLNYVPEKSIFLSTGEIFGCRTINGKNMLFNQAYKAIEIWYENIDENL
ncbi:shikimate dehydrogenase [Clostridium punense]|uniref:Shikimate dehydrogenase (NADP(+)) n=1 Tax=Clostridium punense TaxID=1054297 RepID=A0ABS4JXY5_9CLOT|nr:shikimate dehydrogenase [Clostridium sp. BL8]EQB86906.1 hypothetical protein M918_11770 [Clostridium sp. BL8]MBP2020390.1 shikimate dehydrogenase [Clostridium punense]